MSGMAGHIAGIVLDALLKVVGAGGVVWLVIRSLRRSDDRPRLIFKWLLSAGMIGGLAWIYHRYIADTNSAIVAFLGVALGGMTSLMLFVVWRNSVVAIVARPFEAMYTGGGEEAEPKPFYSIARARQKQGKYEAAIAELRKQLQRFPADVEGQLFLAQIQAEDMKDIPAAEVKVPGSWELLMSVGVPIVPSRWVAAGSGSKSGQARIRFMTA